MKTPHPDTPAYAAWIGLDWAKDKHDIALQPAAGGPPEASVLAQTPEALHAWLDGLRARFGGRPVALCLETSRGALINALCAHDWLHLYPLNPKALACYRVARFPSGAKSDPHDAGLLCDFLRLHMGELRRWTPDSADLRALRTLCEQRNQWVDERTRFSHRLRDTLRLYFPQLLDWVGPAHHPLIWSFLLKFPSLDDLQRVKKHTLLKFLYAHQVRRGKLLEDGFHAQIGSARPLTLDEVTVRTQSAQAMALCRQLLQIQRRVDELDEEIRPLYRAHRLFPLLDSFPGAGDVLGPRLLLAVAGAPDRFASAQDWLAFSGIAPVSQSSGKNSWVHWRWHAPKFLQQSLHEFASASIPYCPWAAAYYHQQTKIRGAPRSVAIRALAFKWGRILYSCAARNTLYEESTHLASLQKKGSPLPDLIAKLAAIAA
jgi:transposase